MHWILVCYQVLFQRCLEGDVARYPMQTVLNFLEQNQLDKYSDTFQQWGIDGDLLLKANDNVLKELGVSSRAERIKIKTKYKKFVKN